MNINVKMKKRLDKLVMKWQNEVIRYNHDLENMPAMIEGRVYERVIKDVNKEFGTNYESTVTGYNKLKDKPLEKTV